MAQNDVEANGAIYRPWLVWIPYRGDDGSWPRREAVWASRPMTAVVTAFAFCGVPRPWLRATVVPWIGSPDGIMIDDLGNMRRWDMDAAFEVML